MSASGKKKNPERFINRDVSWVSFNSRVLMEARDPGTPLLERLKFISIVSSNLDEFFMVRIAGIARQDPDTPQHGHDSCAYLPGQLLARLDRDIRHLTTRQYGTLNKTILPELRRHGIALLSWEELTPSMREQASSLFRHEILPVLTPVAVDPSHPFPQVPNLALELLIRLRRNGTERFAVLEVPALIPRFLRLEPPPGSENGTEYFVAAEEVVAENLSELFLGCEIRECSPFRVTRDMDLSIDGESVADLLTEMELELQKTTRRTIVRLETASGMSAASRRWLIRQLGISGKQVFVIPGYLNLKNMMQIAALPGHPELKDVPMPPLPSPKTPRDKSMFACIRDNGPFLLHHPYESFDPVLRLLEEAADDPDVLAVKQTLYRVSRNSPVVAALVRAARNGKQVSVLFEIKARFDEENNIRGARELAEAGAHVVYGIAGLKVHCKALLIVRREPAGIRRYVHLSTGNYNEKTARQYTDLGYFSDDELLARDTASLFNVITGFSDPPVWSRLLVSPFTIRERLLGMIDRERALSAPGNPGRITMKLNAIIDSEVIEHLYRAAEAGVRVELIVRGICGVNPHALPPEARGRIRIVSILDRFLEHARIYRFANNGNPEYFIGSSDAMPRNLKRRIEILFPIAEPELRKNLDLILSAELSDRRKGRRMIAGNRYSSTLSTRKFEETRSQYVIYEHFRKLHKEAAKRSAVPAGRLTVYREETDRGTNAGE
ncbi:MAG: polyphosphate kinase 1 [Lentisphaeria bacterium]|nr:polyphosphate kinase 1 [Lentisphaeria bacterium]